MNHTHIKNRILIFATLVLLFPVLVLACSAIIPGSAQVENSTPPSVTTVVEAVPEGDAVSALEALPQTVSYSLGDTKEEMGLVELYAMVNPAVVNITIYRVESDVLLPVGQGSGFVYDGDGHIVTNAHVVQDAEGVEVTFSDGTIREADVIGEDLNSDLAVVHVDDIPGGVTSLPLASMETLAVGQTVVAIGNPFGLDGTLTRGVISALGRSIPALTPFTIPQSIQTDAAINPGNSGGPLLNMNGEVIGVNDQIRTDGINNSNLGVGFAIPVSMVHLIIPDLIQNGEHDWAWLGVRGSSLTPPLVEAMDLPVEDGAYFADILPGGPAAKAGLEGEDETVTIDKRLVSIGGDVVTAIDGRPVRSFDDLLIYIALEAEPGEQVALTIWRNGEFLEVTVTLDDRPTELTPSLHP
ncbi:MAG: trypsin-like peptidase domain-containing protein [Anaerolineales bacterium]|nr:trypsin-like peptidase domain-containing protein [Anaerolineales bacterium]